MASIASVRPWALSYFLAQMGHEVTVLSVGKNQQCVKNELYKDVDNVRVIRCYPLLDNIGEDKIKDSIPNKIMGSVKKIYHKFDKYLMQKGCYWLYFISRWIFTYQYYRKEKEELIKLKSDQNEFDVVISTFGGAENFFAGKFASDIFKCPLVQDFRDTISSGYCDSGLIRGYINKKVEKWAIKNADAITGVSNDMLKHMMNVLQLDISYNVIYNGYVPSNLLSGNITNNKEKLIFCYTGTIYEKDDFSALFSVLRNLIIKGKISKDKVVINYAGNSWGQLSDEVQKYNLNDIVTNYGYLTFKDAFELQQNSDIFLVASWNTEDDVGVICGKFSEGIRLKKPMICLVAGSKPNSELYCLNKEYNYGFCYEESSRLTHEPKLEEYVYMQYTRKINGEELYYTPTNDLFTKFRYDFLANIMEKVCISAIEKQKNANLELTI
jgi:hypothetical protein